MKDSSLLDIFKLAPKDRIRHTLGMIIWIVSDGKPGHLSQTKGLVDAFERQCAEPVKTLIIDLSETSRIQSWVATYSFKPEDNSMTPPDFIVGAGHKTHIPLLLLARKWKANSIVCMKSSLPTGCFNASIIPYHDFMKPGDLDHWEVFLNKINQKDRIYPTLGAMNRVLPSPKTRKTQKLILVGGPSKNFGWNTEDLIVQLLRITKESTTPFKLTTSRRTPADVVPALKAALPPHVKIFPVEQTDRDWVPNELKKSAEVWVTVDSVSMIFESLGSGAHVGLISVPCLNPNNKVSLGVELLTRQGYVQPFTQWETSGWPHNAHGKQGEQKILLEADRIARQLLHDFHYPIKNT